MPARLTARAFALVVICTLVLSACTGGDDNDDGGSTEHEPSPAALKPAWTAAAPGEMTLIPEMHATPDGRLHYASEGTLAAYDSEDGDQLWSRNIRDACTASDPNEAGDVAVTAGKKCRDVAVVDGRTGKTRWRKRIPPISSYDAGDVTASIGDRTVTVVQFCGQVTRLSLRDGNRLGVLGPKDRACANEADSDGQLIALWHDPETEDTPDDHGTGWIPSWDGKAAFELYDADTGKRLWRRVTDREAGGLQEGAVVSTDPVILALTDDHHKVMRKYSRKNPKPGRFVGRQMGGDTFDPIGSADGVIIGTYVDNPDAGKRGTRVFAYDLNTGRELWSRPHPTNQVASVAGVDDDGVVITEGQADTDPEDDVAFRTWVSRWDLRTGKDAGVTGRIDETDQSTGQSVWSLADGMLYRAHRYTDADAEVSAYELPEANPDHAAPDQFEWADGDVRPDPFTDPCTAVRPDTLRQLGLRHSAELTAPADCVWAEHNQPDHSDRGLSVNLTIAEPNTAVDTEPTSDSHAVDAAKALVEERRQSSGPGFSGVLNKPPLRKPSALDGVGDEAYATAAERPDATGAYLLVRKDNVVLEVQAESGYQAPFRGAGQPSLHDTEAGVIAAAQDVFGQLDLELTSPQAPKDGNFKQVTGICNALRKETTAVGLPAPISVMPRGSDKRIERCTSIEDSDYGAELNAYAYAAAGSPLTGKTGSQVAKTSFTNATRSSAKPVKGLGDHAVVYRDDSEYGGMFNSDRQVTVRRGNLIVQVDYTRWGAGVGPQMERDAIKMARKLLRTAK